MSTITFLVVNFVLVHPRPSCRQCASCQSTPRAALIKLSTKLEEQEGGLYRAACQSIPPTIHWLIPPSQLILVNDRNDLSAQVRSFIFLRRRKTPWRIGKFSEDHVCCFRYQHCGTSIKSRRMNQSYKALMILIVRSRM